MLIEPKKIELPEPIKQVSCGQSHNLALSQTGCVYSKLHFFCLLLLSYNARLSFVLHFFFLVLVFCVCQLILGVCCFYSLCAPYLHVHAGWGSGEFGQIGYGIKGNTAVPRLVLDGRNISQVAAGRYHSFALTNTGILFSWGCGENGQLGLNSDENVALPTVVQTILGTVVGQVACGEHHTAILTSAPWTKIPPDVWEWLHAAKVEHEFKEQYLKVSVYLPVIVSFLHIACICSLVFSASFYHNLIYVQFSIPCTYAYI